MVIFGAVGEASPLAVDLVSPEGERRAALLADHQPADREPGLAVLGLESKRASKNLRIERACQTAIAGQDQDGSGLRVFAHLKKR